MAAPHSGEPKVAAWGLTHTGRRARNEDCHLIREDLGLVIVADGFSGAAGGDIAARLAVDEVAGCFGALEEQIIPHFEAHELADGLAVATMRFAIEHAHRRVRYHAQRTGPLGMTTAVAVLFMAGPRVVVGHVGSVRVYRFRAEVLEQLTNDDRAPGSFAKALGSARGQAQPAIFAAAWRPGDLYLLCTTGLHRVLADEQIRLTLAIRGSVQDSAAALVGRALHGGAADDMTAVLAQPRVRPGQSPAVAAADPRGA